ncbi:hypothetical protein BN1723_014557 [Verticillium longisporum]|uniref:Uncharacterized protein n=1 Tax=Verticillium longisporum TaxID=100787 RepID=A0A0G4MC15_VERLO|nr:hypothetical protein BN1723_014557 [Verticillium longisporum]
MRSRWSTRRSLVSSTAGLHGPGPKFESLAILLRFGSSVPSFPTGGRGRILKKRARAAEM